jgi:hypothetical protein
MAADADAPVGRSERSAAPSRGAPSNLGGWWGRPGEARIPTMLGFLGRAVVLFAITNIDDLVLLALHFGGRGAIEHTVAL